jgi:hypothetical protein
MAVVEDHKIGDQMIVLDNLQLVVADIFGDGIGPEINPLSKLVEAFALVLRSLNDATQVFIANVF